MSQINFSTYLKETVLVSCDGQTAVVAAPYRFHVEHIAKLFASLIEKQLHKVLGFQVSTRYLAISDLGKDNGSSPPKASPAQSLAPP
jgi:hypothetical protein